MYTNELRSKIAIDQRRQMNNLVFSLLVVLFSVITSAVAPQLLYEYVLQGVSVDQQLLVLQYIPVFAYVVALIAFVISAISFVNHGRRTRMYEQEMMLLEYSDESCNCDDPDHYHNRMSAVDEVTTTESSVSELSAALSQADSSARSSARKKGRPAARKTTKK
jgi:hypothetical protein